ncbi:hypothetical protein RCL_jg29746.t1 [Rhizophagus clarus]|uniref:Uncharacterized protein n=1 Tax=Rhizophagus clarus TaxID=94130 RepID=A0A8H3QU12_9GLOM|nr:hypothetical protein RCL_jg29746.t1 [Rhizophagus clarus]
MDKDIANIVIAFLIFLTVRFGIGRGYNTKIQCGNLLNLEFSKNRDEEYTINETTMKSHYRNEVVYEEAETKSYYHSEVIYKENIMSQKTRSLPTQ